MNAKKVSGYITDWLEGYASKAGLDGFVVGVSGGIDSAVTSTLCAMTGKKVMVFNMPIYQNASQFDLSTKHIAWLEETFPNVTGSVIDLTEAFKAMENTFPSEIQDHLTMANARARLRMTTLYAMAGHYKLLVAGTGNKVEDFGVGFYTKYGDGGVDLSPIADLYKTEVWALGKEIGVIEDIVKAAPTDGLWDDGRTDEDQIGATYVELEWAMEYLSMKKDTGALEGRQKVVMDLYQKLNRANQHKMQPIPVCEIPEEFMN
ncbi:MAG: NAD(+) synthase [Flavobacteriales bacterium]